MKNTTNGLGGEGERKRRETPNSAEKLSAGVDGNPGFQRAVRGN